MTTPPDLRRAAAVLLVSRDGRVLVGERSTSLAFLGGFVVFPGGSLTSGDASLARTLSFGEEESAELRATALRELLEETGLVFDGADAVHVPEDLRGLSLEEIHARLRITLPAKSLVEAGRWITPASAPVRFDTFFFLARVENVPERLSPNEEMAWATFEHPRAVLDKWMSFEILLSPPTKFALEALATGLDDAEQRLREVPEGSGAHMLDFEPLPGIRVLPLLSPTLPPARHTNALLVGDERVIVVDPATYEPEEREKLLASLGRRRREGARIEGIVLTHHHGDHVAAAAWLREAQQIPILAHPITRDLLMGRVPVDRTLDEGSVIDLGRDRSGRPFPLEVLFTPGHAPGHIILLDGRPRARAMIVGDMVAGIGTIIIDPPEGDMAEYMRQLERMRALPRRGVIFPAHGPPLADAESALSRYVAHRAMREEKVWSALRKAGSASPEDLLPDAYDDTPPHLFPLAARSCLAHLEKLAKEGRATVDGGRYVSSDPGKI